MNNSRTTWSGAGPRHYLGKVALHRPPNVRHMDPITIAVMILGCFSAVMGVGQAVETYALWRLRREIPRMVEVGAINLVRSERFRTSLMRAASKEIAKRLKLSIFGSLGVEKKLEKQFAGAVLEGNDALKDLKELLPKRARELLDKHPQLIEYGLKLLPELLPRLIGEREDGQT